MSVRSRWWVDGGEELRIPLERLLSGTNGDPLLYVKGPLQEPAQSFFDSSGNGVRDVFTGRRVCMFVYNDFRHDARVLKEANSLQEAGYDLTVVALLSEGLPRLSRQGGVKVLRVPKNPIHLRFLRALRTATLLDAVRRRCRRAFSACMTWLPGPGAPDQATVLNPDPATLGSYVKWLGGNALSLISLFLFPLWVSVRLLARILGTSLPDSGLPRPDDWEDLPFQQKLLWQAKRFVAYERRRRRELKRLLGLSWSRLGRWHRLTRKSLTLPLLWVRQQRRLLRSGWIRLSTPWLRAARRRWRLSRKSLTLPLRLGPTAASPAAQRLDSTQHSLAACRAASLATEPQEPDPSPALGPTAASPAAQRLDPTQHSLAACHAASLATEPQAASPAVQRLDSTQHSLAACRSASLATERQERGPSPALGPTASSPAAHSTQHSLAACRAASLATDLQERGPSPALGPTASSPAAQRLDSTQHSLAACRAASLATDLQERGPSPALGPTASSPAARHPAPLDSTQHSLAARHPAPLETYQVSTEAPPGMGPPPSPTATQPGHSNQHASNSGSKTPLEAAATEIQLATYIASRSGQFQIFAGSREEGKLGCNRKLGQIRSPGN